MAALPIPFEAKCRGGYVTRQAMRAELGTDIRGIFYTSDRDVAEKGLRAVIQKFVTSAPLFSTWMEENLAEGFTLFELPLEKPQIDSQYEQSEAHKLRNQATHPGIWRFSICSFLFRLVTALLMETSKN